jgi:3alpha(or 20beta)-hydroxysteroid dehydrogenase/cyclopentanol dehydrogenase
MGRLDGKVALVTGAGRAGNIGVAVCKAFLREGAKAVVATDARSDDAKAVAREVEREAGPGRFLLLQQDVTGEADWRKVVATTLGEFAGLDVLVNNAGISVHGGVENTSLEDLRRAMAVNHDALFLGMKHCLPALAEAHARFPGGGAIVNNLSMSSYLPNAWNLGYTVSKAAARMLTLCAAEEFGPRKVRVNSVHPGYTLTPLIEEGIGSYVANGRWRDPDAARAALVGASPLKTDSRPEDTAHAFVYLASEEARFVTGAALHHDGGIGRRF